MASEILGLNATLDAGSWSNNHSSVEKIASADGDTSIMACNRLNVPSTCKFSLEDTSYTTVYKVIIRGRLRYEGGSGVATIYVKDSGGSTITSKPCACTGSYATFEETITGSWSQATVNAFEYWCTFDSGDTPGTNDIRITAGEVEVFDTSGDALDPAILGAILASQNVILKAGALVC